MLRSAADNQCHAYSAFGLQILSTLPLPELNEHEDCVAPAVRIRTGSVPLELSSLVRKGGLYEAAQGRFLLRLDGVARYLVADGAEIVVDAEVSADAASVRLFLLGPVIGALLQQRGILTLHASAIETSKGAVLFAGGSRNGKSAIASAFFARGYRVIADEICAVDSDATGFRVIPAFPRLLLWPDVIEQSGLWSARVQPARENIKKCHVPVGNGFATSRLPIHALYSVKVSNTENFLITRLSGAAKLQELIGVTFCRPFLSGMAPVSRYFNQVSRIAGETQMSQFLRPNGRAVREAADMLERDFNR